eukprot:CAMPEP_0113866856 /NCGR_PEP_ID=MMETSP0780_2-20120614/100_1 /TAXON_ID=652834 /ORGANISM="Palpitomonas bilix" /LENGTH=370 /DNA_ID=CAMNT_0000851743 /DNA_START=424 /DNA_END=1536 /DNA_ORIENTATION=- /assembly_acc=CAM_ASM_000599
MIPQRLVEEEDFDSSDDEDLGTVFGASHLSKRADHRSQEPVHARTLPKATCKQEESTEAFEETKETKETKETEDKDKIGRTRRKPRSRGAKDVEELRKISLLLEQTSQNRIQKSKHLCERTPSFYGMESQGRPHVFPVRHDSCAREREGGMTSENETEVLRETGAETGGTKDKRKDSGEKTNKEIEEEKEEEEEEEEDRPLSMLSPERKKRVSTMHSPTRLSPCCSRTVSQTSLRRTQDISKDPPSPLHSTSLETKETTSSSLSSSSSTSTFSPSSHGRGPSNVLASSGLPSERTMSSSLAILSPSQKKYTKRRIFASLLDKPKEPFRSDIASFSPNSLSDAQREQQVLSLPLPLTTLLIADVSNWEEIL